MMLSFLLILRGHVSDLFVKHRVSTYLYSKPEFDGQYLSKGALHHESAGFMDLMHSRLSAIIELLQNGLNVWFTGEEVCIQAMAHRDPTSSLTPTCIKFVVLSY